MSDAEIIKALEWHLNDETHCSPCPYEEHSLPHYCVDMVIQDALSLINRQQAEIERLRDALIDNEYANCVAVKNGLIYTHTLDDYDKLIGDISAEAIKAFAERLKAKASDFEFGKAVWVVYIDNLVKEMVGEDK